MPLTSRVARLKCTANGGMFPHEAAILIRGAERYYESFVDRDLVAADAPIGDADTPATVSVGVIKANGGTLLIELPREVVAGAGRRIWVPKSEVDNVAPISSGNCQEGCGV